MSDEPTFAEIKAARHHYLKLRAEAEAATQEFYNLLGKARLYGMNLSEVGRQLDVSNQTVHAWCNKAEAMRPE